MTHAYTSCFYKFQNLTQNPKPKSKFSGSGSSVFFRTYSDRSTGPVDRCAQTVHVYISRPTRSTEVFLCSRDFSVDRPGRPKSLNGHIFDRWRSTDPVDRTLSKVLTDPTASFSDCFSFWDLFPATCEAVFDPYK